MTAHTIERRRAWHVIIAFGLAHTVGRRRVWHAIRALGHQTRSNDVGRGMPSPPLSSSHGRTTSGVACYHGLWTAHTVEQRRAWAYTVERRRAWNAIIAFGLADTVGRRWAWKAIIALGWQTRSNDIGVACHHRIWTTHTVSRRRAWHAIIAFGQHTRLDGIGRGMPSPPLDSTHGRTTSGVACHHRLWEAQAVERRRAWHAIIAFEQHKRFNDVGHGIKSPPLDYTHRRMSSSVA